MKKRSFTVGSLKPAQVQSSLSNIKIPETISVKRTSSKPEITFSQNKTSYSILPQKNYTLLDAALEQGKTIDYKCTKGSCGRCVVKILNGQSHLSRLNDKEKEKLKEATEEGYRLACQVIIK